MGKRQKERRKAQLERAVASGDLESIRGLAERNPNAAAHALIRARADAANAEALDDLAATLAARLRITDDLALALRANTSPFAVARSIAARRSSA